MTNGAHHVPGRARFKVPQPRHDPLLAMAIEEKLGALDGVRPVEVTRHAASMTVHFDGEAHLPTTLAAAIRAHAHAHAPASAAAAPSRPNGHAAADSGIGGMMRAAGQVFGQAVCAMLVQRTLERSLLSLLTGVR